MGEDIQLDDMERLRLRVRIWAGLSKLIDDTLNLYYGTIRYLDE